MKSNGLAQVMWHRPMLLYNELSSPINRIFIGMGPITRPENMHPSPNSIQLHPGVFFTFCCLILSLTSDTSSY
ncbi:hypothetical protein HanIR_Chr09g0421091 [Helianthus annuus]|nr:hypothetical protein HanIR_Chr09g0421091 [Helianthus annuus]